MCLFAFTELSYTNYPAFVNLSVKEEGLVLMVRERDHNGNRIGVISLPDSEARALALAILAKTNPDIARTFKMMSINVGED